jgi:hypothetical protein
MSKVTRINFEEGAEIHIGPIPASENISREIQNDLKIYQNYPDERTSIEMKMQKGELAGVTYNEKSKMYEYKGKTPEEKEKNQMLAINDMSKTAEKAVAVRQKYLPEQTEFQLATSGNIDLREVVTKTSKDFDREREERKNLRSNLRREMSDELVSDLFNSKPLFQTSEIKEITEAIKEGKIEGIEKKFDESIGREVFAYKGNTHEEIEENKVLALSKMTHIVTKSEDETMRAKYGLK